MREVTGTKVRPAHVRSGNHFSSPGSPSSVPSVSIRRAAPRNSAWSVSAQRPEAIGSCGGSAAKRQMKRSSGGIGGADYGTSSSSVTGPSLTSSTSMCAPNTPRRAPRRSQKRSYSGSACSGRAAAT